MTQERKPGKVAPRTGRLILDSEGSVVEVDDLVYEAVGLEGEERDLEHLSERIATLDLRPGPGAPNVIFRRTSLTGRWDDVIEIACCRLPEGGWSVGFRLLRDRDLKRGGFQSLAAFLATAAHELQTPLTALKASLQLIERKQSELPESVPPLVQVALRGVNRLIHVVRELVDSMRLESDSLDLVLRPIEPAELLEEVSRRAEPHLRDHPLRVLPPDREIPPLRGDRERLLQVLTELVDNAVKCSDEGAPIEISATVDGEEVLLRVRDEGRGIPDEHREAIFDPFFQVDGSATRDIGGLGLGLAICRGVVERHGGTIAVRQGEDRGSVFEIRLPAMVSEASPGRAAS